MNRHQALIYAMSTSEPIWPVGGYKVDLRLAAFIGAMIEHEVGYSGVDFSKWWSARCQLGMLIGHDVPEFAFEATIPCGQKGTPKKADADDFADEHYLPAREAVVEAVRKAKLLILGYPDAVTEKKMEQSAMSFVREP